MFTVEVHNHQHKQGDNNNCNGKLLLNHQNLHYFGHPQQQHNPGAPTGKPSSLKLLLHITTNNNTNNFP
jgi:hypothetical protein